MGLVSKELSFLGTVGLVRSDSVFVNLDTFKYCVGLGRCRLSINDLETGNQPLSDEDGMIQCVVIGEIYDHQRIRAELEAQGFVFKTKSDSEVVIQLYGLSITPSVL